ncbi:polypeptide N-acetylgalactosaminyltransferase 1-like [Penaeus indicus]|uniref:polypeptide N-acetylgalactosaminyltransferase 1-like n=1 Tax=Penaeus indicus TaxID=29960 RepID=UPI00300C4189
MKFALENNYPTAMIRMCGCRRRGRWMSVGLLAASLCLLVFLIRDPRVSFDENSDVMIPLKSKHKNQEEYIDKRGIHVVVGHYMGEDTPGKTAPNLTDEILNTNGYNPHVGAGENGDPVQIPNWEMGKMQRLYHINKFNLLASDRISVNRSLPDVRKKRCHDTSFDIDALPTTSVVIVFHNEAWSTLLRTVHSVIARSPRQLLREILLVDDASERTFLKEPLEEYVSKLPVAVRVIRSPKRTGLIRARLLGAQEAKGEVLTFLDAHCEATIGWLEPLLSRIAEDNKRVVCPIIDIIHEDTFQYVKSFELHWGAFNWNLHFRWYTLGQKELDQRKRDITEAYRTPAMAGGLFSIHKDYFYRIGAYDRNMDVWGGENLEMSFRVWMCGGSIEIAPCSHVGHVFRKSSPYTFPGEGGVGGVLYRNLARVALVWLDDWAEFYFKINAEAAKVRDDVVVKDRVMLRDRLSCHTFEWYLQNIWPENFFPAKDRFVGKIRHDSLGKCLQRPMGKGGSSQPTGTAVLHECVYEVYPSQIFVFSKKGKDRESCMESCTCQPITSSCQSGSLSKVSQLSLNISVQHKQTGWCLDLPSKSNPDTLSLSKCDSYSASQKWNFEHLAAPDYASNRSHASLTNALKVLDRDLSLGNLLAQGLRLIAKYIKRCHKRFQRLRYDSNIISKVKICDFDIAQCCSTLTMVTSSAHYPTHAGHCLLEVGVDCEQPTTEFMTAFHGQRLPW